MSGHKTLTTVIGTAALLLALAACSGGDGDGPMTSPMPEDTPPLAEDIAAATARAVALASALEAAKATLADGRFDDAALMVAPSIAATHDGTTVSM